MVIQLFKGLFVFYVLHLLTILSTYMVVFPKLHFSKQNKLFDHYYVNLIHTICYRHAPAIVSFCKYCFNCSKKNLDFDMSLKGMDSSNNVNRKINNWNTDENNEVHIKVSYVGESFTSFSEEIIFLSV